MQDPQKTGRNATINPVMHPDPQYFLRSNIQVRFEKCKLSGILPLRMRKVLEQGPTIEQIPRVLSASLARFPNELVGR